MPKKLSLSSGVALISLALLSWTGMLVHNRIELPAISLIRPEYFIPTGIYIILLTGWILQAEHRRIWVWLLFIWVGIQFFVGAWLSVLPLSIWPFYPEQSVRHYLAHALYGLAQVPIIWHLVGFLHASPESDKERHPENLDQLGVK
jgi:hypothetical protein